MQKIILSLVAIVITMMAFKPTSNIIVKGKITDTHGNPVPFATIRISGSALGVSSDANGSYSISVKIGDVLEFSGTGYESQRATGNDTDGYRKEFVQLSQRATTLAKKADRQKLYAEDDDDVSLSTHK